MESFLQNVSLFWLCITALFAFLELFFLHYRFIWFSVAGTGGLICSLFGVPLWVQIAVFSFLGGGLLWFCRNWVRHVRCEDSLNEMEDSFDGDSSCDIPALLLEAYGNAQGISEACDSVDEA